MKIKFYAFLLSIFSLVIYTCEKEETQAEVIPPRDRADQQLSDMDTLQNYLNNHYFNSGDLEALSSYPQISDIEITELVEGETLPSDATLLINAVEERQTVYREIDYTYYILNIEQGQGEHPHFTDQVRVNYEGFLTNNTSFDASISSLDFDLSNVIVGWNRVLPQFKSSDGYVTNSDGTVRFDNYGIGVMFLPSGLAYFNSSSPGIPTYSCLIFKFELQQYKVMDHDNDYIPSFMEDLDADLDIYSDDTDANLISNFLDTDDDGDGFSTYREVIAIDLTDSSVEGLGDQMQAFEPLGSDQFFTPLVSADDGTFSVKLITLEDTNGNGIPNYLDADDTGTLDN
ncbi:MAG: FKBP-type peptidyl-prolyl cis-trans isomerase [Flavobacteriaceae bacterium]|tara:strand:- start:148 stop:1176 length:1029 start_codon:yes stop_codon:yes gene_type:complete